MVWQPGDVKPVQTLTEEVSHVDLKQVGSEFVLLIATKMGFIYTYTVNNGRVQPLAALREFGTKSQTLSFPVLGSCTLKVFSGKLCVVAAKAQGVIGVWKVNMTA